MRASRFKAGGVVRTALGVCALLLVWPAAAQEPGEERPGDSGLVEKVEVMLVQIPIIALDRQGRPVTDLSAEEIVVKDRRRTMRVAFLDRIAEAPPVEDKPRTEVKLFVDAPGAADERTGPREGRSRYVLLFVDVEHDQKIARQEALGDAKRFVRERLSSGVRAAVMSYNGEINLEVPFTSDLNLVADGLEKAYARPPRPQVTLEAQIRQLVSRFEDCVLSGTFAKQGDEGCMRQVAFEYADEVRPAAQDYITALEGMVKFLGGLEGHKSVLAISHGLSVDPFPVVMEAAKAVFGNTSQLANLQLSLIAGEGARVEMDRLVDLALRRRVTLHFIDRNSAPSSDFGASQGKVYQAGFFPARAAFTAAQNDLEELATHTGGVFVHSPNALREGLDKAMNLEQGAYTLGYYVDRLLPQSRLRKVRIETSRKRVRIAHRRGYYSRTTAATPLTGGVAFGSPQKLSGEGRSGLFLPFQLAADPAPLGYNPAGTDMAANLTLHVRVEDESGRSLADSYHFLNHAYPRELWDAGDVEPITIRGWIQLPPGRYTVAALVKNARTGQGGEISQEVLVPDGRAE